ncbi:response regulator transcription factor [Polaribacter aquimarinus]|uniref:DNA-binding response regulator n=1 Tax=Polaribacter aquimarinus TaxID=2100726 RepID=A0A2U2JBA9_9FLAO|nr:response regulator transcription factor [Polaribacter aquimarinus]PWG05626.1 DNA-binding response regulator [Polaribacter aquimarinus]
MEIKLIIIDDHKLFVDGLIAVLNNEIGIKVIGSGNNGSELFKLLEKGMRPDIVLLDINMPILDGVSTTKLLTKNYPKIKVLALSMHELSIDVTEMLDAGAKGYITKDIETNELITAIHAIKKGEQYFSENLPKDIKKWFYKEHSTKPYLTRREKEILNLLANGRTSLQMAEKLKLSRYTIDTHRKNIHKKLGIKTNTGLVNYIFKNIE